ncbi:MAG TPA: hypothetical protein VEL11_00520 [Candidatus Bathyarchaeia archaeon]|nr:hypothetical protein [Candidatus Bathyarchaeia archaeon]
MNTIHSSFKRFVPNWKATWLFIVRIISIITGKRFRKIPCFTASSENRIHPLSCGRRAHVGMTVSDSSSDRDDEIFNSLLVQSIRENHANTEKISDFEWEDIEHQDSGDVF